MAGNRFYERGGHDSRRFAPAASRNREPIADVLADWLPTAGLVLEVASGTGEHVAFLAARFPSLEWQPSDTDPGALESIRAWRDEAALPNLRAPVAIDASKPAWRLDGAAVVLNVNMVHISPWASAIGLLDNASRLLSPGAPLILYGPWLSDKIEPAPSNLAFDADLKRRNPQWGLRNVEAFAAEAKARGLALSAERAMPANNSMLLFRKIAGQPEH